MNSRPWPVVDQINPVNTAAETQAELSEVFATLNNLIAQFNQLVGLEGGLKRQIQAILKKLATIFPDSPANNSGYLTNADLLAWQHAVFQVGVSVEDVSYPQFTLTPGTTSAPGSFAFQAAAGAVYVLGSGLYLDATNYCGLTESSGVLVLNSTEGVQVVGGVIYMATPSEAGTPGIALSGANLEFYAPDGMVVSEETFQAAGYLSSPGNGGNAGATATTGGVVFQDGLYISGSIEPSPTTGYVEDTPNDSVYYTRFNDTGAGDGVWSPVSTALADQFPGIAAGDAWAGSTDLVKLGTVTTGTWSAAISTTASVSLAAFSASGNATLGGTLAVSGAATLNAGLTVNGGAVNVDSYIYATALYGYGSGPCILRPGANGTGAIAFESLGGAVAVAIDTTNLRLATATIEPLADGTAGLVLCSRGGAAVLTLDTTNRICYPYRMVLPSY